MSAEREDSFFQLRENNIFRYLPELLPGETEIVFHRPTGDEEYLVVAKTAGWSDLNDHESYLRIFLLKKDEQVSFCIRVVKDSLNQRFYVTDTEGKRLEGFESLVSIKNSAEAVDFAGVDEIKKDIELKEKRALRADIFDEDGKKICVVSYDPVEGRILQVETEPFVNLEATAEKNDEHVYVTDKDGEITEERLTRKEAREKKERYLLVSCLLFQGNEILLQRRSKEKSIDPDKLSTSAHGVAKEIKYKGKRSDNVDFVSIVNCALEINEELRCGEGVAPFKIKIWQYSKEELFNFARAEQIDEQNTIYLVPEVLYGDEGYSLGNKNTKRTRSIFSGFIFSKDKPMISVDQNEVQSVQWKKMSEYVDDSEVSEDARSLTFDLVNRIIQEMSRGFSARVAAKEVSKAFKK